MKKFLPYVFITIVFLGFLFLRHRDTLKYKFNPNLISDYLRSQDIEDPGNIIKNRIFLSDSDLYIASGYLYAKGADPTEYDFQVPALIKYFFGFSTLFFDNPLYIQIVFGLILLWLTYFLGTKLFKNKTVAILGTGFLLFDPVLGGMMKWALLDLGQTVFALSFIILVFFYPERFILQGITLGLFAGSKFWSTAVIFIILIAVYKILIKKEKPNLKKNGLVFLIALFVYCLIYIKSFINLQGGFNIFLYQFKVLKYMWTHNSAGIPGGPIALFISGYFLPWWQNGILRAEDWSFLWPVTTIASLVLAIKTKISDIKFFFFLLPILYILLISTQVPFARYFLIVLPYAYLNFSYLFYFLLNKTQFE
jgi:predicted membrane-bound dolichyl-phosphate-mannose-protein mannosyltransferase